MSSSSPNGLVAWIDYNNNGEFEPNEIILDRSPTINPTAIQTFVTPATTGAAIVRMRVKVQYNYPPNDPCTTQSAYGDTQDFLVQFGGVCDEGPSVSGSTFICEAGRSTSLTAGCATGGTAKWYTKASGGTLLHTGSQFTTHH